MLVTSALIAGALAQTGAPDPDNLSIGRRGTVIVKPGQIVDTATGQPVTTDDVAKAAEGNRFFFLGEEHATAPHQQMEATVIKALQARSRKVMVGLEMYTRPKQDVLDKWSAGDLAEDQFLTDSDWKGQWGFPYQFYRPVFETVRLAHLPLVGLNVPREWVRFVGKGGYAGLPTTAKLQLPPDLYLGNQNHRQVFTAMIGGAHPGMSPASMENMYAAQVLWDTGMADTALKYLDLVPPSPRNVFVVIAGAGHVMYKQGIPYRIERRKGGKGTSLVMIQSNEPVTVAKGLADFVYVSAKS